MLLNCDIHLIVTMRSKQGHILEENAAGKKVPKKVGMEPVQRDGIEYEFSFVFDLAMNHEASVSKTDASMLDGRMFKTSKETGEELLACRSSSGCATGKAEVEKEKPAAPAENCNQGSRFTFQPPRRRRPHPHERATPKITARQSGSRYAPRGRTIRRFRCRPERAP